MSTVHRSMCSYLFSSSRCKKPGLSTGGKSVLLPALLSTSLEIQKPRGHGWTLQGHSSGSCQGSSSHPTSSPKYYCYSPRSPGSAPLITEDIYIQKRRQSCLPGIPAEDLGRARATSRKGGVGTGGHRRGGSEQRSTRGSQEKAGNVLDCRGGSRELLGFPGTSETLLKARWGSLALRCA